jgi:hypothetical protein
MSTDGKELLKDAVDVLSGDEMSCGDYKRALLSEAKSLHLVWFREHGISFINQIFLENEKRHICALLTLARAMHTETAREKAPILMEALSLALKEIESKRSEIAAGIVEEAIAEFASFERRAK